MGAAQESVTLVDIQAAAVGVDRSPQTIYSWIRRGHLPTHGKDGRRILVAYEDVWRLANATESRRGVGGRKDS